jgi:hypothetical protein
MAAVTGKESARMTRNLSCPIYQRDGLSFAPDMVNKPFFRRGCPSESGRILSRSI